MTMKTCFKCGDEKDIEEFYLHPQMSDGRLGKCKECTKTDVTKNRNKNIDRVRAYDRQRGSRMTAEDVRKYRAENPEKYKAHCISNNAVRDGRLISPGSCEGIDCDSEGRLHKHHNDYSKPIEVRWLCPVCHSGEHKEKRNALVD